MSKRHIPTGDLNHTALIEATALESGVSREDTAKVLRTVFDVVGRSVAAGHTVTVSNFGIWHSRPTAARVVRNPKTGETRTAPASRQAWFRWSPAITAAVRTGSIPATFRKKANH